MKALFSCALVLLLFSCNKSIKVDLIVHNAGIYLVDDTFGLATAMAIKDGKVVEAGASEMILKKYKSKELLDAQQQFIFPGFIDAHAHFTPYALDGWKTDLTGATSFDEVLERLPQRNGKDWIYGRGWDQHLWKNKSFPSKEKLDSLYPNTPVFLKRVDGHAALVNQKGLELAGIDEHFKIASGEVVLENGKPTGLLIDKAMEYVDAKIKTIEGEEAFGYIERLQRLCHSVGLTSIHDCGISEQMFSMLQEMEKSDKLTMNLFVLLSDSSDYYNEWLKRGIYKSDKITMGGFKVYGDGALGSRGACLKSDYSDRSGWRGFLLGEPQHFSELVNKLINSPFQMCTHAIGDSANAFILKTYASVLKGKNDRRWRLEHAQVVDTNDLKYFIDYNIIPSVQPTHAISDMLWAAERLGMERMPFAYAYKKLLQTNGWMPLGTDFPVESMNPVMTFYSAVARKNQDGKPAIGFQMNDALTREEAMRGITIWAAKAAFQEKVRGSLEPGKVADFVIIDTDLMNVDEADILNAFVLKTFVNGVQVYASP